jgi:hypothetical protein
MQPFVNQVLHRVASPLWRHVTNTLYGEEVEPVILDVHAANLVPIYLVRVLPRLPVLQHIPVEVLDPQFCAIRGNDSIRVA